MNYAEIKPVDIANGPSVRVSLFVSGCTHHCKGCFNEVTWDFNYGKPFTDNTIKYIMDLMRPSYIKGITILGGEPFEKENQKYVLSLLAHIRTDKELCNKSIWIFSGYTIEQLDQNKPGGNIEDIKSILSYVDVLVDGPFIESKKNLSLRFRGSENQRIIDMKKSIYYMKTVLWEDHNA